MNFSFVETPVFMTLNLSVTIYFNFASLENFLGPEISVWNFDQKFYWLCVKTFGPGSTP